MFLASRLPNEGPAAAKRIKEVLKLSSVLPGLPQDPAWPHAIQLSKIGRSPARLVRSRQSHL